MQPLWALILLLLTQFATAATATITWSAPTLREDGSALSPSDIAAYQINLVDCATGKIIRSRAVMAPTTSLTWPHIGGGNICFTAYTIDTNGLRGQASAPTQPSAAGAGIISKRHRLLKKVGGSYKTSNPDG